ncbi:hypothetical protein JTB14_032833 [Gonioctena quinquepunctata]|nr:hypothetical protein JTB14_032833 [Gonioctena quinquepunctata]
MIAAVDPSENEIETHSHTQHVNLKSPANILHDEVDILRLINVSSKDQGVSIVEGPITKYPAFKFRLPYGNIPLSNSTAVIKAMNDPRGFTGIFLIRQQKNNLGTLMSVNSPGRLTPWFQLTSNSRNGILTLKYRLKRSNKLRQLEWSLPKHHRKTPVAAWTWLSISFDSHTGIVRVDLDCNPSRFEPLKPGKAHGEINVPSDSLVYFGQEPGRKKKFLGSVQIAKVVPYVTEARLWSCMQISSNLSPEFQKPLS